MISFAEFEIALLGLLRLARFDAGFAGFFDLSARGARRSFLLALPLLPIVLFLMHLNAQWPEGTDMGRVLFGELIGYALGWTCFPLALFYAGQFINAQSRIFGAIAVYNWLSVLSLALHVPISFALYYGLDPDWANDIDLLAWGFVIACEVFAFWRLLGVGIAVPLALALADFVMTIIILGLTYSLTHNGVF
jgi:hypothetical protein